MFLVVYGATKDCSDFLSFTHYLKMFFFLQIFEIFRNSFKKLRNKYFWILEELPLNHLFTTSLNI